MAVLGPYANVNMNGHNNIHSQLTKSLERILEDAFLSGELKLSGRKLKEFPKPAKYDLSDTVVADLSKNRFSEVPDEVTTFVFLEKLLLSQNVINNLPDAVGSLQSLTYLDLSFNQLTELPREVCQMPLQVLLVNDNLLTSLPKEIGRMATLAELDAARNRLTQVPMTLGDCPGLRALDLSNNQLGLLPLQITYLRLEHLDVSCNCISSLPLELRNMSTLVTLQLDNNPLVSPPTTVCMRGRVHIFKYLENMAHKENGPVHRRVEEAKKSAKHNSYVANTTPLGSHHITSGNNTIDCLRHRPRQAVDSGYCTDGIDKRWSNEGAEVSSGRSTPSTPSTVSPCTPLHLSHDDSGLRISPEGTMSNGDDKSKLTQQTYRQYKEALRQQRQTGVYRRADGSPDDLAPHSPAASPAHTRRSPPQHTQHTLSPSHTHSLSPSHTHALSPSHTQATPRRPVQKVVPNRTNGDRIDTYTKPTSPTKSPTYDPMRINGDERPTNGTVSYLKNAYKTPPPSWNKEVAAEKLSFTMKREFDKQREETELLQQLRAIIESRLKMRLPATLPPALSDGVVLCHLANHVRARAVASVHVPSPAQPKLTMARCRRNVDNFLEACRRIGVEEDVICSPEDILGEHSEPEGGISSLARTVFALLAHATSAHAHYDDSHLYHNGHEDDLLTTNYSPIYTNEAINHRAIYNRRNRVQFVVPFYKESGVLRSDDLEIYDIDEVDYAHETEDDIERYDRGKMNLEIKNNLNTELDKVNVEIAMNDEDRKKYTCLCLGSFLLAAFLLYWFPM